LFLLPPALASGSVPVPSYCSCSSSYFFHFSCSYQYSEELSQEGIEIRTQSNAKRRIVAVVEFGKQKILILRTRWLINKRQHSPLGPALRGQEADAAALSY